MPRSVPSRAGWRTSSHSGANGSCVQVAVAAAGIAVRDSQDPHGPGLTFTARRWAAFTAALKSTAGVSEIRALSSHAVRGAWGNRGEPSRFSRFLTSSARGAA
jgi:Domain of unknown function (DUF397)